MTDQVCCPACWRWQPPTRSDCRFCHSPMVQADGSPVSPVSGSGPINPQSRDDWLTVVRWVYALSYLPMLAIAALIATSQRTAVGVAPAASPIVEILALLIASAVSLWLGEFLLTFRVWRIVCLVGSGIVGPLVLVVGLATFSPLLIVLAVFAIGWAALLWLSLFGRRRT